MNDALEESKNHSPSKGADMCTAPRVKELSLIQKLLLGMIRTYQLTLSPFIGRQCRFYPTCSHYASEAIEQRGALRGSALTLKRLAKCHPFHPGGVDLVPLPQTNNKNTNTLATHL